MTTESSIRISQFSKVFNPSKIVSCSPSMFSRASEPKGDHGPGDAQSSRLRGLSHKKQPQTINVILFGEAGVGKSSVVNLIARKEIAKVSSDVNGCTMQHQSYRISFDNMDFAIFDTIGLEQPQMAANGYLKTMEKAHELISKLSAAGGVHLLMFCMRGGRMTPTTRSNYQLFRECLCNTNVPIALVFTGLETEVEMEDWWKRNETYIEQYGLMSDGHACITAVPGDTAGEEQKYEESQETIRKLLKTCSRKGEAFSPESQSWFQRTTMQMKEFVPAKKFPKKKDILRVLTNHCKLDADTAKRFAEMMDKGDAENKGQAEDGPTRNLTTNDPLPDLQVVTSQVEHGSSQGEQDASAVSGVFANGEKEVTKDDGPPQELGSVDAKPGVDTSGGKDVTKKNVWSGRVSYPQLGNFRAVPSHGKERNSAGKSRKKVNDTLSE